MLLINKQTLCKDNKSSRNLIELEQEEKHWHLDIDITKFPPRKHGNKAESINLEFHKEHLNLSKANASKQIWYSNMAAKFHYKPGPLTAFHKGSHFLSAIPHQVT